MNTANNTQASTLVLNKDYKIIAAGIHTSVNELGTILDAYQQLVERLEQRNKLFKALACSIAHEMRNPFNAIAGCVEVIQDEPELSPHLAEYIGYIDHSVQHGCELACKTEPPRGINCK
jgi:signal transduction histidine kinase